METPKSGITQVCNKLSTLSPVNQRDTATPLLAEEERNYHHRSHADISDAYKTPMKRGHESSQLHEGHSSRRSAQYDFNSPSGFEVRVVPLRPRKLRRLSSHAARNSRASQRLTYGSASPHVPRFRLRNMSPDRITACSKSSGSRDRACLPTPLMSVACNHE